MGRQPVGAGKYQGVIGVLTGVEAPIAQQLAKDTRSGVIRREVRVLGAIDPSSGSHDSRTLIVPSARVDRSPPQRAQLPVSEPRVQRGRPYAAIIDGQGFDQLRRDIRRKDFDLARLGRGQFQVARRIDWHPFAGSCPRKITWSGLIELRTVDGACPSSCQRSTSA